jgi:acetyl-CoA carboxylase biotin carboxyl carrier protein
MQIQEIKELMDKMNQTGLSLLELESEGTRLCLKRESWSVPCLQEAGYNEALAQHGHSHVSAGSMPDDISLAGEDIPGLVVTSPAVGIFYAAPSPDNAPFVSVGSLVETGSPLCIIEAMKLMNEVTSPCDGIVLEIYVENGKRVEFGQPLMRIGGD